MGRAPEAKERPTTRTTRVFEVELGLKKKSDVRCPAATPLATNVNIEEPSMIQEVETQADSVTQSFEKYTVAKNDTLQKISKKFFGTTRKWNKIYEANKDTLRTPDKLYPGQVLNIPSGDGLKETSGMKEPKENLK